MERPSLDRVVAVERVVDAVLQLGCQHGGLARAVRGDAWVWLGGSCAHLARGVVLARSLRRQRRVHE